MELKHTAAEILNKVIVSGGTALNTQYTTAEALNAVYDSSHEALRVYGLSGGTGSGATSLNELTDVTLSSPSTNEVLVYDGSQWINSANTATDTGATSLNELTDVTLSSPSTNEVLVYDGSQWINSANTASATGVTTLNELTDVNLSGLTNADILQYNSATTMWENKQTFTVDVANPQSGDTIIYNDGEWTNSAITAGHNVTNGLTLINNTINYGGSLTADTTLDLSGYKYTIKTLSATTTYDDSSYLFVTTDDGTTISAATDIENYSVGIQDDNNHNLSYLDINLNSGITISSNNASETTSGNTNYIIIDSDSVEISSDTGNGTKILMTATDGSTQYYLTVDASGNLTTTAK